MTDGNVFTTNRLLQEIKALLVFINMGVWVIAGGAIAEAVAR